MFYMTNKIGKGRPTIIESKIRMNGDRAGKPPRRIDDRFSKLFGHPSVFMTHLLNGFPKTNKHVGEIDIKQSLVIFFWMARTHFMAVISGVGREKVILYRP